MMGDPVRRSARALVGVLALLAAILIPADPGSADIDPAVPSGALAGAALSVADDYLAIGAPGEDDGRGAVYVYRRVADVFELLERIDAGASAEADAGFGSSVSLSRRAGSGRLVLVVGAPGETVGGLDDAGAAYSYRLDGATFVLQSRNDAGVDAQVDARLGAAVGVANRNAILAGAPGHDVGSVIDAGAVFTFSGGVVDQFLTSPDAGAVTEFGAAVDTYGASVAVGAPGGDGATYLLGGGGNIWRIGNTVTGAPDTRFGASVARDAGTVLVGAPGEGSVRLFENGGPGIDYVEVFSFTESGLGTSVAILDGVAVAASADGRVFAFSRIDGVWQLDRELTSSVNPVDGFGSGLAIEDSHLFVGHSGADLVEEFDGTYDELPGRITPDDSDRSDAFGTSVSTDGVTAIIGAPFHDDGITNAGAAYLYDMTGAEPVALGRIIASNAGAADQFGTSVAVAGRVALVGAVEEDSAASNAGSVYLLVDDGAGFAEVARFTSSAPTAGARFGSSLHLEQLDADRWVAAVGARGGAGRVDVFLIEPASATPVTPAATIAGPAAGDAFGYDVAMDGIGRLAVGAPGADGGGVADAGAVLVFDTTDTTAPLTYTLVDTVASSRAQSNAGFGRAVDVDGPYLAVGAPLEDISGGNSAGIGYGFALVGGSYEEQVIAGRTEGTFGGNQWGSDVAIEGEVLVIAVPGQDDRRLIGRALVRDGDTWTASEQIRYSGPTRGGVIGQVVSLTPDGLVLAGAPGAGTHGGPSAGAAFLASITIPQPTATVIIGRPTDGATYEVGDAVEALFVCRDAAGDPLTCTADVDGTTIESGQLLPTGSTGTKTLTVTAGGTTATATYEVIAAADTSVTVDYQLSASTVSVGATAIPLDGAPAAEIGGEDVDLSGISAASLDDVDFGDATALGDVTLGQLGLDTLGPAAALLSDIPLPEFPVDGGWEQYLVGTIYEGVPLQTVTLGDVYDLATVQSVPLRFSDVAASPLRFSDIAVVGFAGVPVLDIDLDGDPATDSLTEWCDAVEDQGLTCAEIGLAGGDADATLGALAVAGFEIQASPLRFSPLRFSYIEASPLRFSPLRFSDIEASPLRFSPLRFSDIQASPLRFSPLRFSPLRFSPLRFSPVRTAELREVPLRFSPLRFSLVADIPSANRDRIVDCAIVDCGDGSTATIDDAIRLGAYVGDTATYDDLGDTILGELRVEDVLPYLDADVLAAMELAWETSDLTLGDLDLAGGVGGLTLGDLEDGVWEAIEAVTGGDVTVEDVFRWFDFEHPDFPDITIGDFLLLFLPRESVAWDEVDIASLGLQTAGDGTPITGTVDLTVEGVLEPAHATVTLALPESAVIEPGSISVAPSTAVLADVDLSSDQFVTFRVLGVEPGVAHRITFDLYAGLDLGTTDTVVEIDVGGATAFATTDLTVTEAFEPGNDAPGGAVGIVDDTLYLSHISTATDVDYYRLTVPDPDTAVSVILSNLPADYDLVVHGPPAPPIVPTSGEVETVPDPDFDVNPANDETAAAPLDDIVTDLPGFDLYGVSYNRDTRDDQVDFVATIPGDYLVQVAKGSTLGAEADQTAPYALRVATIGGTSLPCPARTLPGSGTVGTSTPISPDTNTLFVVNQERLGQLHGATAAEDVMDKLVELQTAVNADATDGVQAAILAVDSIGAVRSAYDTWDASPCDLAAVNAVVEEITDEILAIRATNDIDHVMIVGGDDAIPFARVDDATRIANEQGYASSLGSTNNALRAAMAAGQLLTDEPYGDRSPVAADNREVYVTEVSLGRLVEGPTEIITTIDLYLASGGVLDPQSGFVAGYDFLDDGSEAVADALVADLDGTVERLINDLWSASDLGAGLTPPADVNSLAAHFDHFRALPADESFAGTQTDLYEIDALSGVDYSERIVFSMGCHAGLSVSDDLFAGSGVEGRDWAQTFLAQEAAVYVGATGYAYGDDVAVALTEKLMVLFAEGLGTYATVGEAMLYAKQEYSADLTAYGVYDEKALMESTMYGIPFFRLGNPPVDVTITEPTLSASPFGPFANLAVSPDLQVAGAGGEDQYWFTVDEGGNEQVQVTSGYPILPTVELEVTQQVDGDPDRLALDARGVMIESLTTTDVAGVDAATARAVYDLADAEPNTDPGEVTFALAPTVNTFLSPGGIEQQVTMTVAAFESTAPGGVGTMRLYDDVGVSVYYADVADADTTDPVFRDVVADLEGGVLTVTATVGDAGGVDRVTALVTATPQPGAPTEWRLVELTFGGGVWTGSTPVAGDEAEFLLQALDAAGNVGTSLNKQLSFGTDLPPVETITIGLDGSGSSGVYRGPVTVSASSSIGAELEVVIDSVGPVPYDGSFVVFTPGLHRIRVISETGKVAQVTFRIVGPACTIIGTEGPDVIVGTPGPDVICALDGADVIDAGGGDDIVFAGGGPDEVDGGPGDDTIDGGDGPDVLVGGEGDDLIDGGNGPDELDGGPGTDTCAGLGEQRGRGRAGDDYTSCEL